MVSAVDQQTGSKLSFGAKPGKHIVAWEPVVLMPPHFQLGFCRHTAQSPYLSDQRHQHPDIVVAILKLVWLESGFADGVAPACPVPAMPISGLDASFLREPVSAQGLAAVGRSR